MSLTKSNKYVNVSSVQFVYTAPGASSPTTVPLIEVEDIQLKKKGTELKWSADAAPGPTAKKVVDQCRDLTLIGADVNTLNNIPPGQFGVLTWTEEDFYNGASTGATNHTMNNFSFHDDDHGGKHNEVKKATVMGSAIWTLVSGVYIDPYIVTQVP